MPESAESAAREIFRPVQRPRPAPGPRGHRLLGNLLDVRRDRLRFVRRATASWGDLVAFRMGPKKLYLASHPDHFRHVLCDEVGRYAKGLGLREARPLLGDGLLTSEGAVWRTQRSLLQRAFGGDRLEIFAGSMSALSAAMADRWDEPAREGRTLDVAAEMVRLTLGVLGATLLPGDLASGASRISADLDVVSQVAMRRMTALVQVPLAVPTPASLRLRRAVARLERLAAELVESARERAAAGGEDLLSLMLAPPGGEQPALSSRQVRDEVLTFLLAGHETTAAVLSWTWYLLALHPAVEARLHAEVDRVLEGGRGPVLQDLPALSFTRSVLDEVVRLFPPVWLIPRKALGEDVVGGYAVPAGADMLLCVYTLHRHPRFWEDPDRFDPDRFAPGGDRSRHSHAYLPFGAGPRACLGSRFGMMEATLAVASLARRYRLELAPGTEVVPEASLTLKPRGALGMRPVLRES